MEVSFKRHITGFLSSSVTFNESHHMSEKKNKQKQTVILYNFFLYKSYLELHFKDFSAVK